MTAPAPASDPRYPIGPFAYGGPADAAGRAALIESIAATPARLRAAVAGLDDAQLDTPYRDGGWTVRQVVHHVPDSHLNAYTRCKLAVTEDRPTIKPYDEAAWAGLDDARTLPVDVSLALLEALHVRWVHFLRSLPDGAWAREISHPEWDAPMALDKLLALYAWHGRHHEAHVVGLRRRMGW
jgi:uncharacterized damage-inducible protein DinB